MKTGLAILGVGLAAVFLTGCIVFSVERKNPPPPPAPEVVVVPSASADSVVLAEIEAAAKLDFDSSRLTALNNIASRTNLSAAAQVCLVSHVFKRLDFDSSKITVLNTLVGNPGFCNAAKQTVLTDLSKLSYDNDRASLLASINQRGELKD